MAFKFVHPASVILCGPSKSGKTWFIERVFKEKLIRPWPRNITWYYSEWQDSYDRLRKSCPSMSFVEGIVDRDLMDQVSSNEANLIVIDDQMDEAADSKQVSRMFTKGSHHRDLSVILFVQNMFHKGKESRTQSLNTNYYVIFNNPRDKSQIRTLSCQMYPQNSKFLVDSFDDATKEPYGYLLLDLRQETHEKLRVMRRVFPSEECEVYVPVAKKKGI